MLEYVHLDYLTKNLKVEIENSSVLHLMLRRSCTFLNSYQEITNKSNTHYNLPIIFSLIIAEGKCQFKQREKKDIQAHLWGEWIDETVNYLNWLKPFLLLYIIVMTTILGPHTYYSTIVIIMNNFIVSSFWKPSGNCWVFPL